MSSDGRPTPERLLAVARSAEPRTSGGRLKIFLGYAPGVGKTYTMLEAAQSQRRAGIEVAVGIVLTHGRAETADLLEGLPSIPLRSLDYRGTRLEEFDLDAALKRRPGLLLVDELAHTNAPGSRHAKRWQDVFELLNAGIDIYTTVNIQHVESLHDVILRMSAVDVRERVPNEVLDRADEVELVDLPPPDLLERLRAGKVYLGDAAERAISGFFAERTLDGLRELALRQVADRVRSERAADTTGSPGKLLVCVGPSPQSAQLLRATRRMAERMQAGWIALHVQTPESVRFSEHDRTRVAEHLQLADRLGADVHEISGDRLAETVVDFARRHDVSRIVVGKPLTWRLRERLRRSLVSDLIRSSGDIDVYVITGEHVEGRRAVVHPQPSEWDWLGLLIAVAAVAGATALCFLLAPVLAPVNLCMVYLLAVVLVGFRGRRGPVITASVLGVGLFDYLFVPPLFTFSVHDAQYLLTFVAMLLIGLTVSTLVSRLRAQVVEALRQAGTAQALHRTSRDLAATRGTQALIDIAQARCRDALGSAVAIVVNDAPGAPSMAAAAAERLVDDGGLPQSELAVAQWVLSHGEPAGAGTETLPGSKGLHVPLTGTRGTVGVLSCLDVPEGFASDPGRRRLIEALAKVVGLAIECDRLASAAQDARVAADAERLRSTLLSSISHDLRTPLAAIAGSASTLLSGTLEPQRQRELLSGIADESERMARLVTNLLDIVRLESGAVRLTKVPLAIEDLVGAARAALGARLAGRTVTVSIPPDLPPVPADEVLIQSVLINLLENAAKYTPATTSIVLSARQVDAAVEITVADHGPGIPPEEAARVFDKFYRGAASAGHRGAGLGLSICRSVVEAHGGRIAFANRAGGGAEFRFTIPLRS
jgi:two-component system sensor histidine kinase KdpD